MSVFTPIPLAALLLATSLTTGTAFAADPTQPEAIARVGTAIGELLAELDGKKPAELRKARRKKFLDMGQKSLVA